jgi:hypothetical protein
MRHHLSRKTLVPSKRKFQHGRSTIVGRLVVLSVFMLGLGVPSTPAQTGQDERCAAYRGQAHGLCTAAVAEGCFDGVQSPECDDLTANWRERCRPCIGGAPWAGCPCAEAVGSAVDLNARFEGLPFEGAINTGCIADEEVRFVQRFDVDGASGRPVLTVALGASSAGCAYVILDANGARLVDARRVNLDADEIEACREDIESLMAQLGCL